MLKFHSSRSIKFHVAILCLILVCLWAIWPMPIHALPTSTTAPEVSAPAILIVNSYDRDNLWTQDQNEAFVAATREKFPRATFYYEYLSSKKFSGEAYELAVVSLLHNKYSTLDIDYIYTTDDDATRLMTRYRERILPQSKTPVPIIFSGLNNRYAFPEHVMGVQEVSEVRDTVALIRSLQGASAKVLAITDDTTTSDAIIELNALVELAAEDSNFSLFSSASIEAIQARLRRQDYDAIVFLLFNRDDRGQSYDYLSGYKLFQSTMTKPVYSTWDFYFGSGLVGGKLIDGQQQGSLASEILIRHALQPNIDHPILIADNTYTFDWTTLKRHGISETQLPKGSKILNRPENYFEKHREVLLTALAIILCLLAIIVILARSLERHVNALKTAQQHVMELQKTEALYRILISLSHELNTFIGNALMLTSHSVSELETLKLALQSGQTSRSEVLNQLDAVAAAQLKIHDNLEHSGNVLETLKSSHLDNPNRRFALIPIESTLNDALDAFKDQLQALQVAVTVQCSGEIAFPMDEQDLNTMVTELLHNALDHGFTEGYPLSPQLHLQTVANRSELTLLVQDNGVGIKEERLPFIFDPFATADLGKRKGLGLFHLKQLIQTIYDGRISCESSPGKGTSFSIHIHAKALD